MQYLHTLELKSSQTLSINSIYIIADNIQAVYDVEVVGEDFLKDVIDTCLDMKTSKSGIPYLIQQYNISGHYPQEAHPTLGLRSKFN